MWSRLAIATVVASALHGASAYNKGDKIKVVASHVGPVNNPSEVSTAAQTGRASRNPEGAGPRL
jgi:hypothetical protein